MKNVLVTVYPDGEAVSSHEAAVCGKDFYVGFILESIFLYFNIFFIVPMEMIFSWTIWVAFPKESQLYRCPGQLIININDNNNNEEL